MKKTVSIALVFLLSLLASFRMTAQTRIIKGDNPYGEVLYNFDGKELRAGSNRYSEVLYNWDGEAVRQGYSKYSEVLYNFDGTFFRQGNSKYSKALYNWDGSYIRKGDNKYGTVLYSFDGQYVRRGDKRGDFCRFLPRNSFECRYGVIFLNFYPYNPSQPKSGKDSLTSQAFSRTYMYRRLGPQTYIIRRLRHI